MQKVCSPQITYYIFILKASSFVRQFRPSYGRLEGRGEAEAYLSYIKIMLGALVEGALAKFPFVTFRM